MATKKQAVITPRILDELSLLLTEYHTCIALPSMYGQTICDLARRAEDWDKMHGPADPHSPDQPKWVEYAREACHAPIEQGNPQLRPIYDLYLRSSVRVQRVLDELMDVLFTNEAELLWLKSHPTERDLISLCGPAFAHINDTLRDAGIPLRVQFENTSYHIWRISNGVSQRLAGGNVSSNEERVLWNVRYSLVKEAITHLDLAAGRHVEKLFLEEHKE